MAKQTENPAALSRGTQTDREFVSEAEDILEQMRGDLADLYDQRSDGSNVDPEVINSLFRSAHTLKSLAALFGFDPIRELAHQLEDILDGLRLGRVSIDSSALALIEDVVRLFGSLLGQIEDGDVLSAAGDQIAELIDQFQELFGKSVGEGEELGDLDLDPTYLRALTEYEEHRLRENVRAGSQVLLVDTAFEIISFEEGLSALTSALRQIGEVVSTLPSPGDAPDSEIRFSLLVATNLHVGEVCDRIGIPDATVTQVFRASRAPELQESKKTPPLKSVALRSSAPAADGESLKSISETVRVDIHKLDDLMNLVGELAIQRGAIERVVSQLQSDDITARAGNDLAAVHKVLDRKLRSLQAAVLDVRMVPLGQVFEKVSRVVRGLRRDLQKDVRFEVSGASAELDKLIVEELVDPLMHIVRNSLDHGIESERERVSAGKEAQGTIRIEAFQRGNHVVISVSDDGAGIDTVALRARAEEAGIVRSGDDLTEQETLGLIFLPGLSTRPEVTGTSGRGVGMDVVRANLAALGGLVEVQSTIGRGTTISVTLPITLAIIQSLIVNTSGQRFAIALNSVRETILVDGGELQLRHGREMLNLRGEPLLLKRLAVEFGLEPTRGAEKLLVVVLAMGDQRLGLIVDKLEGQQDTVIKPIQGPVRSIRGIAGATELGGQEPVLVLDVVALVEDATRRREVVR